MRNKQNATVRVSGFLENLFAQEQGIIAEQGIVTQDLLLKTTTRGLAHEPPLENIDVSS